MSTLAAAQTCTAPSGPTYPPQCPGGTTPQGTRFSVRSYNASAEFRFIRPLDSYSLVPVLLTPFAHFHRQHMEHIRCRGSVPSLSQCPVPLWSYLVVTDGDEEATRFNQTICPLGHYCDKGIVIECPPGRYGGTLGLYDSGCSGPCDAGYYCPSASINKTQVIVVGCCVVCV
jgi:hypothetical protein